MKIKKIYLILIVALLQTNCEKYKKMKNKTKFGYQLSLTAPKEYPVEVYLGYLSAGDNFITTVPKTGVERNGWKSEGSSGMSGGSTIPDFLEVTWLSYAEKKFWKLETKLPADKILALFREGFIFNDARKDNLITQETYNQIVIGAAPGGVVVVWLDGGLKRVEIGRYQAKEIYVDKLKFQPIKKYNQTQQEFFETKYEILVSEIVREQIRTNGLPYGLWDSYRKKYHWRFKSFFYKEDKETFLNISFFNGEFNVFYEEELDKKDFKLMALPNHAELSFNEYWAEIDFNEKEIFAAFKQLNDNHPDKNIEIEAKVGFMYKTVTFIVICEGEEIPLEKTKVKMWKRLHHKKTE